MKTFIIAIICLAACAFAVYEIVGLIKDIKNRKKKKENSKEVRREYAKNNSASECSSERNNRK